MPRIKRSPDRPNEPSAATLFTCIEPATRHNKLIALDGQHWRALQQLTQRMALKNTTSALRFLIRAKARELACWSEHEPELTKTEPNTGKGA